MVYTLFHHLPFLNTINLKIKTYFIFFSLILICFNFKSSGQFNTIQIIASPSLNDNCFNTGILGTLSVANPDPNHTYIWFYEDYTHWVWPGYAQILPMTVFTGTGPSINFSAPAWAVYGCTYFYVTELDQAQNNVGGGDFHNQHISLLSDCILILYSYRKYGHVNHAFV